MKVYYLFSKSKSTEALYVCKDEKSYKTPSRKSEVYPLGTIFSKAIQLLTVYDKERQNSRLISNYETLELQFECWYKNFSVNIEELFQHKEVQRDLLYNNQLKHLKKDDPRRNLIALDRTRHLKRRALVEKELSSKKEADNKHSFSSTVNDDCTVILVLEALLKNEKQFLHSNREYNQVINLLKICFEYIQICQSNKDASSLKSFEMYATKHNIELPQGTRHISADIFQNYNTPEILVQNSEKLSASIDEQKELFDRPILQPKFSFIVQETNSNRTNSKELLTPIYVYEIRDVIDLILVSLLCIHSNSYVLSECEYCHELFVTHNRSMKYCPNFLNKGYCQLKAKGKKRALEEKNDKCKKLRKKIRTRFYDRIKYLKNRDTSMFHKNDAPKQLEYLESRYENFKKDCKLYKKSKTDKEFIDWMNKFWDETKEELDNL